eukprot:m.283041 g.283041  ORF g.283041 m.283041 type:complete len:369 (+) comp11117_c0_seq4:1833-2939(+)
MALVKSLFKRPGPARPKGVVASIDGSENAPYAVQQADLLFLPHDEQPSGTYKYALCVADIGSRHVDARPLRTKEAKEVLEALQDIWRGEWLQQPPEHGRLETDDGKEFMGPVDAWLRANKIQHRRGIPGRHAQQSLVENLNKLLGQAIFLAQAEDELRSGEPSSEWVESLPEFIQAINTVWQGSPAVRRREKRAEQEPRPETLLQLGTRVRIQLDRPVDLLTGRPVVAQGNSGFRATDHRWSKELYEVVDNVLLPGESARYIVAPVRPGQTEPGRPIQNASFARHQLQVLRDIDMHLPGDVETVRKAVRRPRYEKTGPGPAAARAPAAAETRGVSAASAVGPPTADETQVSAKTRSGRTVRKRQVLDL